MRKPTGKEVREYQTNMELNIMFRAVDSRLAGLLTPEERAVVMTSIWPEVQDIASQVLHRTMKDLARTPRT